MSKYGKKPKNKKQPVKKHMQNMLRFDLLCEVNCRPQRLSFIEGRHQHPIGIFPFKGDSTYFELEETEETLRFSAEENRLPERDWCDKVYPIKKQLNKALKILGAPILSGAYFALSSNYMPECCWIVGFDDNKFNTLSSDYYDRKVEKAKIRYVGKFEKK